MASIVGQVYISKLPDLAEVKDNERDRDFEKFDALALRLERRILSLAGQLKVMCVRIAAERNFSELEDRFDELWFGLYDVFAKFRSHCSDLNIQISNYNCLTLTENEDESSTSSSDMEYSVASSSEEEEVGQEMNEE